MPTLQIYIDHDDFGNALSHVMSELRIRDVDEGARIEFWDAERGELKLATEGSNSPRDHSQRALAAFRHNSLQVCSLALAGPIR